MEKSQAYSKLTNFALLASLLVIGMLILALRNPDPFLNPIVYAEDGSWVGFGLSSGWLHTFIHARSDYFVFLNIALLFLATKFSILFSNNPLTLLPESITIVSLAFYSAIATFAFAITKNIVPNFFRIVIYLLLLLIPLGFTGNEIIGRLLQVGYYMPFLAVLLFFLRDSTNHAYIKLLADALITLCMATNPVIFALAIVYLGWDFTKDHNFHAWIKRNLALIILLSILLTFLLPHMLSDTPRVRGKFIISNFIETFIGRPIAYPFIFPWYNKFSNVASLIFIVIWLYLIRLSYQQSKNPSAKQLMLFLFVTLLIVDVATIVMRPKLTEMALPYYTSAPDRYFMGLNILAILLFMVALSQLAIAKKTNYKFFAIGIVAILSSIYLWQIPKIFETYHSSMPMRERFDFSKQMCLSEKLPNELYSLVPIYPIWPAWYMTVPTKFIDKSHCKYVRANSSDLKDMQDIYTLHTSHKLQADLQIKMHMYHQDEKTELKRIGIMFGLYGKRNPGTAELHLRSSDGKMFTQHFALTHMPDNRYYYFTLDAKHYVSGEILSVNDSNGISIWESHDKKGRKHTCIIYEYVDRKRLGTPGCAFF